MELFVQTIAGLHQERHIVKHAHLCDSVLHRITPFITVRQHRSTPHTALMSNKVHAHWSLVYMLAQ